MYPFYFLSIPFFHNFGVRFYLSTRLTNWPTDFIVMTPAWGESHFEDAWLPAKKKAETRRATFLNPRWDLMGDWAARSPGPHATQGGHFFAKKMKQFIVMRPHMSTIFLGDVATLDTKRSRQAACCGFLN